MSAALFEGETTMQIVSLIVIGIGLLIAYGGYVGIRSGKMEQAQFGSGIREKPPLLEGEAARRQGRWYIVAGIVLIAVGVVLGVGNVGMLLALIGLLGVAGGVFFITVGWRGIRTRDVIFEVTVTTRTIVNRVRRSRMITHHYTGTPALVVGVGYLLMALGFIGLGVGLMFFPAALVVGVAFGLLGFFLWLGSDAVAMRMSPNMPIPHVDLNDSEY
jgi:hypothetical protein